MTEIHERRWRCNWCGVVSPVLEPFKDTFFTYVRPLGWIEYTEEAWKYPGPYHFCCTLHETLWKNKRAESAETPEEAKV